MNTSFPQSSSNFLKAANFQDQESSLTYKGWEKKSNDDDGPERKNRKTWKDKLDFVLRYSYPEFARDKAGEPILGKDGSPLRNRYWDPRYPHGYTIIYYFNEGQYETGSKPLWEAFCLVAPKPGEKLVIKRTGKDKETKWFVTRASERFHKEEVPSVDVDAFGADMNLPPELESNDEIPF